MQAVKSNFLIGIDICSNERIEQALNSTQSFQYEVFSPQEIKYCQAQRNQFQHYGARWAAKEALIKAVGENILSCNLAQIEVLHQSNGQPSFMVNDVHIIQALEKHFANTSWTIQLSISHEAAYSVAMVVVA